MLIPSFKVVQADDCLSVDFSDITGWYDAITNPCGYSPVTSDDDSPVVIPVNPTKPSITRTAITITTPSGEVIVLAKTYLPTQPTPLTINCADLIISGVVPVVPSTDSCGCGIVISTLSPPPASSCFFDGCWTFQYDVFATETLVTYDWNITSFTYAGYCVTLVIDGVAVSVGTNIADEAGLLAALNTLDSGYFTIVNHVLSVSSFSHTYGNLVANDAVYSFHLTFSGCGAFVFPMTFNSITINGTLHTIAQTVNNWNEIVAIMNTLGLATFTNGGGSFPNQIILQTSCESITISAISFSSGCTVGVSKINPDTFTFTPTTESVDEEVLVGTRTQTQFLYCNVKNLRKNFKLTQLKSVCDCNAGLVCEMDSDYSTMLIAANQSGTCGCQCGANYLKKTQADLAFLLKQCP